MTSLDRGWHYPSSEYYCLDVTKQCGWKDLDDRLWVRRRHSDGRNTKNRPQLIIMLCFSRPSGVNALLLHVLYTARRIGEEQTCDIWNGTV